MKIPIKKTVGGIVLIALIFGLLYNLYGSQKISKDQTYIPIKVGAIYDLSGATADIGRAMQEGTEIAKEIINASGGVHGQPMEVLYEDAKDQNPKLAINAGEKLMRVDKVKAVLDLPYGGLASLQRSAETTGVPIIDAADASDEIASFGDWVFGVGVYDEGIGSHVADFATNTLQVHKVGVLVGKDPYLLAVTKGFTRGFTAHGGAVTTTEEFSIEARDLRTQLSKIIQSGAETIFIAHFGEGGLAVKQARELGFTGTFLGTDTFSLAIAQQGGGDHLNDSTYFALWDDFDAVTQMQNQFVNKYKEKYRKDPGDYLFYNVLGYDVLMVVAEAMNRSDLSGDSIKDALYTIHDFPGLIGPITIDTTGITREPHAAMVMYKNAKIVRVEK